MKEAMLYEKLDDLAAVRCDLCGHHCVLGLDSFGICGARQNKGGKLYSISYGRLIASAVDPVEKKPLFHYLPGSLSFSIASAGCNFQCRFCQNYSISQLRNEDIMSTTEVVTPESVVGEAVKKGCRSISYTYTEPTVNFEFIYDCSKLAKEKNIKNVWITNGFMTKEAIEKISPYMDAANVDLKAFKEETYGSVMGGRLENVLDSIKMLRKKSVWIEITTLVVPDMNDSDEELKDIASFIKNVDPWIPWHVSAYHADYKYATRKDRTPDKSIEKAARIGHDSGLNYVYSGNIWGSKGEHTYCHSCKKIIIERYGFTIRQNKINDGKCSLCNANIPGIWE